MMNISLPMFIALQATPTVSTITDAITSIVTAAVGWVTSWANEIVATPLLLFFIILGVAGFGISAIMRIVKKR